MLRVLKFGAARIAMALLAVAAGLALPARPVAAQLSDPVQSVGVRPDLLKEVGIDQKLNQQVPLDLTFRDETGKTVQLRQYFGQKPVLLSLVYFNCPMLCTQVLNGMEASMKGLPMDAGNEFNAISVSIDPSDKPVHGGGEAANVRGDVRTAQWGAGLAFPDRRRRPDQEIWPTRWDSATPTIRIRSNSRMPARSWC